MKIPVENLSSSERVEIPVSIQEQMEEVEDKPLVWTKNKLIALLITFIVLLITIIALNQPIWINKLAELIKDNRVEIRYIKSEIDRLETNLNKLELKDKALTNEYNLKLNSFIWK